MQLGEEMLWESARTKGTPAPQLPPPTRCSAAAQPPAVCRANCFEFVPQTRPNAHSIRWRRDTVASTPQSPAPAGTPSPTACGGLLPTFVGQTRTGLPQQPRPQPGVPTDAATRHATGPGTTIAFAANRPTSPQAHLAQHRVTALKAPPITPAARVPRQCAEPSRRRTAQTPSPRCGRRLPPETRLPGW